MIENKRHNMSVFQCHNYWHSKRNVKAIFSQLFDTLTFQSEAEDSDLIFLKTLKHLFAKVKEISNFHIHSKNMNSIIAYFFLGSYILNTTLQMLQLSNTL